MGDVSDGEEQQFIAGFGCITEAVLQLLLRTLTPDTPCLSHLLMGLGREHHASFGAPRPMNCLDAILELMRPDHFGVGTSFVQLFPALAVDCYELLYRVCSSPVTATFALARLRAADGGGFVTVQISVLLHLMHLSDGELQEGLDRATTTEEVKTALLS